MVSPCLALLHTHTSYLGETERKSHAYEIGNIQQSSLMELWQDQSYVRLRERLQEFDFSPCAFCNSCQMAEFEPGGLFWQRPTGVRRVFMGAGVYPVPVKRV